MSTLLSSFSAVGARSPPSPTISKRSSPNMFYCRQVILGADAVFKFPPRLSLGTWGLKDPASILAFQPKGSAEAYGSHSLLVPVTYWSLLPARRSRSRPLGKMLVGCRRPRTSSPLSNFLGRSFLSKTLLLHASRQYWHNPFPLFAGRFRAPVRP